MEVHSLHPVFSSKVYWIRVSFLTKSPSDPGSSRVCQSGHITLVFLLPYLSEQVKVSWTEQPSSQVFTRVAVFALLEFTGSLRLYLNFELWYLLQTLLFNYFLEQFSRESPFYSPISSSRPHTQHGLLCPVYRVHSDPSVVQDKEIPVRGVMLPGQPLSMAQTRLVEGEIYKDIIESYLTQGGGL